MKKVDILILNWKDIKHPQVGGAEIIVYELAKRLVKDGHKVTWFTRSFKDTSSKESVEGIDVIRRGNLITVYLFAPFYYWSLKKKPDLVVDMSNTIYWQTPLWVWDSKKVAYLNQLAMEVFDWEYSRFVAFVGKLIEKVQYITYKKVPFLCYSNSTKSDLVSMGVPAKNVHLFSLGIDHDRYFPGEKSKAPLFICVSRLVRMKRTHLAVEAMRYVVEKYPGAKLVIVGYGYERLHLEELRDSLDLQKNVFFQDEDILFFEKDTKDAKVKLMQQAWALIFPSVKEGWGMTVTECASCGTPSIVSDVTGLKDSVKKDKTGLVLSKNPDPEEIANAMVKLIENKSLRIKLQANSLELAKELTWEKSYKKFTSIIKNIVGVTK
jgi:glycosyltransferase involved in cell wall biosynthesis